MLYKYFLKDNYEDYSSGRVIPHKSQYTNYPVRLAGEIFSRCLEYMNKPQDLCIYDPCCGSGYLLTVLGFLFNEKIRTIYASDISEEAVNFAQTNLSLLTFPGIEKRKIKIKELITQYNKDSHIDAMTSLNNISAKLKHEIKTNVFIADILKDDALKNHDFTADIIITDVPYGNLAAWSDKTSDPINTMLNTLYPVINEHTVIAISHDKKQKIANDKFRTLEKLRTGKRLVELIQLSRIP